MQYHQMEGVHSSVTVVYNRWTGTVDWNGGLERWNALYARKWRQGYTLRMHTISNAIRQSLQIPAIW